MNQRAELEWREGGVPVSTRFDDPYFSLENGLAETEYVFLGGNDLPQRFCDGFHIGELGFGTGLNFLAALRAFREGGVAGKLHFTSFEAFPMRRADAEAALDVFADLPVEALLTHEGEALTGRIEGADFTLEIVEGDARETLPKWQDKADAWFLDGFAPAKNPELWGEDLLAEVARHTAPGGTAATYTAAGHVRRALQAAGFEVTRRAGFGRKRHMTTARMP
ncbi:tRNA (5-methylaminomethyl-2-thiouridine)(34)-methyltransferase MnmD [Rhodalgimonas zhirmunskyi]|uniref:tRNA (5-methylaminomethyl-2-thiouridine)(34)-methyltransferase MnmD n=1 Tax=Rhodalgimonas zhirmunskyi TaxID=2964767 RepID=A0AAJ1UDQ1_9RHOB|nr:tRNA (5-methylaminomethyl-2-thiouridine)(34)-methyltransferase MnmD [Rhodoalgimonas zhirmunskyi]MDQ2094107.1 tRNA (5-methylaminomethyl-2-thiouridine)(34)-methyltransferase MnmD [Rhodoalgimonas zhirmunskyi]